MSEKNIDLREEIAGRLRMARESAGLSLPRAVVQRMQQLQARELPDRAAESIVLRAWEQGLVGTRLLRSLLDEWRHPTFDEFEALTAWSMLAALTHVVKERQRRYPTRAALEVKQCQAILAA